MVLIDMEMPDCCLRCPFYANGGCKATMRLFPEWMNVASRPKDCPMKPFTHPQLSAADVVPVVRCKDCKHRPTKPEKYDDGFDLAFPDEVCPCYCDNDPFYSRYPEDDWFCPRGERKGGNE